MGTNIDGRTEKRYPATLLIKGPYACFTNPLHKVERVSYDVPTPSALLGVVKSIYWKPEMDYEIKKIKVLNKISYASIMINELYGKVSTSKVMSGENVGINIQAPPAKVRAQRRSLILRDVAYLVDIDVIAPKEEEHPGKHYDTLVRRLKRGSCFHTPYLGIREYPASVELVNPEDKSKYRSYYENTREDLGWMLHSINYEKDPDNGLTQTPRFYHAQMLGGVIDATGKAKIIDGLMGRSNPELELVKLYDRMQAAPNSAMPRIGYTTEKVTACIVIGKNGETLAVKSIGTPIEGKKKEVIPVTLIMPIHSVRGSSKNYLEAACFCGDTPDWILGDMLITKGDTDKSLKDKANKQKADTDYALEILSGCTGDAANAYRKWLEKDHHDDKTLLENIDALTETSRIAFIYKDKYVHDDLEIQAAWDATFMKQISKGIVIQSAVTGEKAVAQAVSPNIKQSALIGGMQRNTFTSFNDEAFFSYYTTHGNKESQFAPVDAVSLHKIYNALNYLRDQKNASFDVGNGVFCVWSDSLAPDTVEWITRLLGGGTFSMLETENSKKSEKTDKSYPELELALNALWKYARAGVITYKNAAKEKPNAIYIYSMCSNQARIGSKYWAAVPVKTILDNIAQHYMLMGTHPRQNNPWSIPSPHNLLLAGAPPAGKDRGSKINNTAIPEVMAAIVEGNPYPYVLLDNAMRNCRSEFKKEEKSNLPNEQLGTELIAGMMQSISA